MHLFVYYGNTFCLKFSAVCSIANYDYYNRHVVHNINTNLIKIIESLYNKATSGVYYNGTVREWLRTTVGIRQGCLLSPTLSNIFLERIMTDSFEDQEGSVGNIGRTIRNLRFPGDIDAFAGKEKKLSKFVNHLDKASTAHGMGVGAEKSKLMSNNTREISSDIKIGGQNLETVQSFKYLGSVMTDDGSKQQIMSRIARTVGALSKLKTRWKDKKIALSSKSSLIILSFQ